jgi:signal transduction histidine kinase
MSLRIKLPLFTSIFVLLTSLTLLVVFVSQSKIRCKKDIETIKRSEIARSEQFLRWKTELIYAATGSFDKSQDVNRMIPAIYNIVHSINDSSLPGTFLLQMSKDASHSILFTKGKLDSSHIITDNKFRTISDNGFFNLPLHDSTGASDTLLCYAKRIGHSGWFLVSGKNYDEISKEVKPARFRIESEALAITKERILFSLIMVAVSAIVIVFYTRKMTRPVVKLVSLIEDITSSKKNFSARIDISSNDEIGRLSAGFNLMLDYIEKAIQSLKDQQYQLIQADKMATLGTLVSGIAHEINNPNNFIILNGENLQIFWKDIAPVLDEFNETRPDYTLAGLPYNKIRNEIPSLLSAITDGAHRIERIVQGLKDFARIEVGDLNRNIDIREVIQAAILIVGNLIKKSTGHFSFEAPEKVPLVKGNFQRLEQVMINLITNACQATENKSGPISVLIISDHDRKYLNIEIRDKGVGIDPNNMKHIMDPFFTTKRDSGGTGLGLSIAYAIIKDHNGELVIESEPGTGTCAKVCLPVQIL